MNDSPVVVFDRATAAVGGRTIWSELSFAIEPGEFVAVLGPNGVGKSTLVRVAVGVFPLASGRVTVLDRAPGAASGAVGYLPQRRSFDPSIRVRGIDIVRLGLDGHRWGTPLPLPRSLSSKRRDTDRRVAEAIALVDAERYADRPIGECSGGEQQRLLIAQALVRRPAVLFLDEPLDGLDLPNQQAISALIASVSQREQTSVVMVAHDVNPIVSFLDRVIYLGPRGAVVGTPGEVITSERLSALFDSPIEVLRTSDGRTVVVGLPDVSAVHGGHHHDRS